MQRMQNFKLCYKTKVNYILSKIRFTKLCPAKLNGLAFIVLLVASFELKSTYIRVDIIYYYILIISFTVISCSRSSLLRLSFRNMVFLRFAICSSQTIMKQCCNTTTRGKCRFLYTSKFYFAGKLGVRR